MWGERTSGDSSNSISTQAIPGGSGQADECTEVDRQFEVWVEQIEAWAAEGDQAVRDRERARNEEPDDSDVWAAPPTLKFQSENNRLE